MSDREDIELQRYFDGELSRRRAQRVHRRIQRDAEDRGRLEALRGMGDLIRTAAAEADADARFDGLWSRVERGIAAEQPRSTGERLSGWLRRYRLAGGAVVAGLAAALAVLVLSLSSSPPVSNDCQIESLELGPQAVSTIFKINDPGHTGETTVIWLNQDPGTGEDM